MKSGARIRKFRWQDLDRFTDLFNQVTGAAGSERAYNVESMRQFLSQPSCRPEENCHLAEIQDTPVGFVLISPETAIGRAVASGGVLEPHRHQGIGRQLIGTSVRHAGSLGARVLHIEADSDGAAAHHILETEGFQPVKTYWQMRWRGDSVPPVRLAGGLALRAFKLGHDEEGLTELQNASFGPTWGFNPNTVEDIQARVRLKGSDPDGIILLTNASGLAAYTWTLRASNESASTGWIAMTGVHPDHQGQGLGTAAVAAGIAYLKATGVDAVELEVDSENEAARELYLKVGFKKFRETVWYERQLS